MEKKQNIRYAARVFHPGEILLDELNDRQLTQAEFSAIIDRPPRTVNEIIKGKRAITPETAEVIAAALGTSADMWLGMQGEYDLYLLNKKTQGKTGDVKKRSELYTLFPISDLIRRKYISARKKADELTKELLELVEKKTIEEYTAGDFAYLKTTGGDISLNYVRTWIILGKKAAKRQKDIGKFDKQKLSEFAKTIRDFSSLEDGEKNVIAELNKLGVRVIVLPHFSKTRVDGAACWLENDQPVILMSLRFDRIDNFYFTLLHEIGHILLHDQQKSFIDVDIYNPKEDTKEQEANDFALVSLGLKDLSLETSSFSPAYLTRKSEQMGIHPGLLIGRLQHLHLIEYYAYRKALVKIEHTLPKEVIEK